MSFPLAAKNRGTLRRLASQARPYWGHLVVLFLVSFLTTPLTLLNPVPLKLVVDCVLGDDELPGIFHAVLPESVLSDVVLTVAVLAGLLVLIALVKQLAEMLYAVLRTWIGEKLVVGFRSLLFRHVQRLSLAYHDAKGTGDTAYRIQWDAPSVQWVMVDALVPLGTSIITVGAMLVVLIRIDWQLALVAIAVIPALYTASSFYGRRLKAHWMEAKNHESAAHSVVQEVLGAVRVVKSFASEDREQRRFEERAGRSLREQLSLSLVASRFALVAGLTMAGGSAVVLFLGARHVQAGTLTLGDLILVMSYVVMLYAPMETLTKSVGSLQGSLASADRAFTLLDEEPEVEEKPDSRPITRARGDVVFENVGFAYSADRIALQGLTFEARAGQRIGIAGHTGAGKSTLISLLLRFYDPTSGRILLDGVDLRDYSLRDLRNQFGIVLQEPVLFAGSIGDNIAYARPEASKNEIIEAARAANVHEFIAGLPDTYNTYVGDRGVQLSGGERQRISLARAFLKNAPVLILDEPTSSVDVDTEAVIVESLERLMKDRTSFMIAHRLSTLDLCDVRMELADGKLKEFSSDTPRV